MLHFLCFLEKNMVESNSLEIFGKKLSTLQIDKTLHLQAENLTLKVDPGQDQVNFGMTCFKVFSALTANAMLQI